MHVRPYLEHVGLRDASLLLLLLLHLGLGVLDLPAQVGDDVRVLRDVVGHIQQVALDLVAGRGQGQGQLAAPRRTPVTQWI